MLGFAQSSGGLARSVGPILGGFLFKHVSDGAPFFGGLLAACISCVVVLLLRAHTAAAPKAASAAG